MQVLPLTRKFDNRSRGAGKQRWRVLLEQLRDGVPRLQHEEGQQDARTDRMGAHQDSPGTPPVSPPVPFWLLNRPHSQSLRMPLFIERITLRTHDDDMLAGL
jgi:hypothetical protein